MSSDCLPTVVYKVYDEPTLLVTTSLQKNVGKVVPDSVAQYLEVATHIQDFEKVSPIRIIRIQVMQKFCK